MRRLSQPSTPWTRRIVSAVIILIIAVSLSLWISKRERQKYDDIRKCVDCLCQSMIAGSVAAGPPPCPGCDADASSMQKLRSVVLSIPDGQLNLLKIEVAPKGSAPFDRGSGSHEAIVLVGGTPRLGLYVDASRPEQVYITGYWEPQAR